MSRGLLLWCTPAIPICDTVMGSGLWGGEHVHIAIHIVIHMSICASKQFLVDFVACKLF